MSPSADRNLLFGILALQMDFVTRDQLVAAMNAWVLDKAKPIGDILRAQNALDADTHALLEALVQKHLAKHDNDAEKSLAALSSLGSAQQDLKQIADPDVQASVGVVASARPKENDPYATLPQVGEPTSAGLRFRILRPHAEGGLGRVSVAEDSELHREVALKEIKGKFADHPESRARFVVEAEITGGLEHPGIVPVYGLGTYADGRPFYAMRFIRGDSLKEAIKRFHESPQRKQGSNPTLARAAGSSFDSLEFRQLLGRFIDVCNAVAYAHSRKVLHRDLKPGNIMLGKYGETLVVDWGLAKAMGQAESASDRSDEPTLRPASGSSIAETLAGEAIGTPEFMSPEQASGRLDLIGPATDIYSLGATLYAVLTGRAPISGANVAEVLHNVERGEYPPVQAVNPKAPPALVAVCGKAMALKREDRYGSALDLAAELERWLADEPVTAWREPMGARLRRRVRKHSRLVAATIAALAVGTSTFGVAAALLTAANERERAAANREREAKDAARESADNERGAKEVAQAREAETNAVLGFVENKVFAAARPKDQDGGLGYDVQLRDAIKTSLPLVGVSFREHPLIEARLRQTLGLSFIELGDAKTSAEQFKLARALYLRELGPDHRSTIANMNNLANSYQALGRYADALKLNQEALALTRARFGPDDPDTLGSMNNLSNSYTYLGRYADALKLREEALARRKAKYGPDHVVTLGSLQNLANSYADLGRTAEAIKLLEEALTLYNSKLGPDHPDTLACMHSLAGSYRSIGRYLDAQKLFQRVFDLRKAKLGPDHPATLKSMCQLAVTFVDLGRDSDALKLAEETLKRQRTTLGAGHPSTLGSMVALAAVYDALGRQKDALNLREEVLTLWKTNFGPDSAGTLESANELAISYTRRGRYAEAVALFRESVSLQKAKHGPDHPLTLGNMVNLAIVHNDLGEYSFAAEILEPALTVLKAKMPDHQYTFNCMTALANSYGGLGRNADAFRLRAESLALQKAKYGPDHPATLLSMTGLANGYESLGRHMDALKLRETILKLMKAKFGTDHPETFRSMVSLANSHVALERYVDASRLYEEALKLMKIKHGLDHPDTLSCMNNLASTYAVLGRHNDALTLRTETLSLRKGRLGLDHPDTLMSMWALADSLVALDRGPEAVMMIDECLTRVARTIVDPNLIPAVMELRLRHFEKTKDVAGCRQTAEMWEKLNRTDAGSVYNAACNRAVAAGVVGQTPNADATRIANAEAVQAMTWLRKAIAAGFANIPHLLADPDLAPLRGRADYADLLWDIADTPAAPPKP